MLKLKTILHPTDFSASSDAALHMAVALARDHGAKLMVLHVAQIPQVAAAGISPEPPILIDKPALENQLRQLQVPDERIQVERLLNEGDPAGAILDLAKKTPCDLIVMGSHGRTGLGRLLMGSVAEQVLRGASCPVLVVKTPMPQAAPAS